MLVERTVNRLDIVLNRPGRRNVIDRHLRAELLDALRLAEDDATITEVVIRGNGPSFSSGTDLDELGETTDVGAAHARGLGQSVGLALHRVADRVTVELHGPCFGAGIEVPAFASRIVAQPGTTVGLPALGMGLVPGDGGTASIRRRIGPWRTAFMVLSGATVGLEQALDWGLVDERSTDAAG
ncbi:enoyl-CoA hydratase/isomerase family protein [Aeromicrobium sp. UC242_57]|uniref:enoyl-CoA hydratase/isomerase family protein n=1 Tax=Aeromicrobium sp. UC242_57 TaxID=3374624 RepID=UPI0037A3FBC5